MRKYEIIPPSGNTYAIHMANDGEVAFIRQVLGYLTSSTVIEKYSYISYDGEHSYREVDIFATIGSFTVMNDEFKGMCFTSIDTLIYLLESRIPISSIAFWLDYEYTFSLLKLITGIEFDENKLNNAQKKLQEHIRNISMKQLKNLEENKNE